MIRIGKVLIIQQLEERKKESVWDLTFAVWSARREEVSLGAVHRYAYAKVDGSDVDAIENTSTSSAVREQMGRPTVVEKGSRVRMVAKEVGAGLYH